MAKLRQFISNIARWRRTWATSVATLKIAGRHPSQHDDISTSNRLGQLAKACCNGQIAAVELDLYQWQRQSDCPAAARVLLAALLARRGENQEAFAVLLTSERKIIENDATSLQMLIALMIKVDLSEAAQLGAEQLHYQHGHLPVISAWLGAMQMPGNLQLSPVKDSTVKQLVADLMPQLTLLTSLVAAQKVNPRLEEVQLLQAAIAQIDRHVDESRQKFMLCQAMVELSELVGDHDEARRWGRRGLKIDPYSAALALLLSRISDDETVGPEVLEALSQSATAHPTYPDLRAALIRRQYADGQVEAAHIHLTKWLQEQPAQKLALQLRRELAA